jgi:hypothetical protein
LKRQNLTSLRVSVRDASDRGDRSRAGAFVLGHQWSNGVLASVLGVMLSMAFGISTMMLISAACHPQRRSESQHAFEKISSSTYACGYRIAGVCDIDCQYFAWDAYEL